MKNHRNLQSYKIVRDEIQQGDLLLFRKRGIISLAGRGRHSHAAKAIWWDDGLFCVEIREWFGGRAVTLSSQVEKYPGKIDVYEANPKARWPEYDRRGAASYMRRLSGCRYGWGNLILAALLHLPLVRWFVRADVDDSTVSKRPPFCSQAIAMADRIGGHVDPVPHLADRLTEPTDLARSAFYKYRFTLLP